MDNDKLINVFEMLCERLGKIEESVSAIKEHIKETERTKLGRINNNVFGWKFKVTRTADFIRDKKGAWQPETEGSRLIQAAFVSYPIWDQCLPAWYYEDIVKDTLPQYLQECLKGVDVDSLVKMEKDLLTQPKEIAEDIKCSQLGVESQYKYVSVFVAQQILKKSVGQQADGVQYGEFGMWIWTSICHPGYTIDELVNIIQPAFEKLGVCMETSSDETVGICPIINSEIAQVASFMESLDMRSDSKELVAGIDNPEVLRSAKQLASQGLWYWSKYIELHEMTKPFSKVMKELLKSQSTAAGSENI